MRIRVLLLTVLLIAGCSPSVKDAPPRAAAWPSPVRDVLADYDAELRRADGRVDLDAMVARLKDLGVTSYYWLIWHASTDWEDLKLFLPKAAEAGIAVTAYLVPPSESPPRAKWYSEPFRLDYMRWGEEIARLSLAHPNLRGWIIDDFYGNRALFSPGYVRAMQARAKAINRRLAFMPLMYYPEITAAFAAAYGPVIDGVVAAYPPGRGEISRARAVLNAGKIPLIVMSAGSEHEFRLRYGDPAAPERMAQLLRMCLEARRDGLCDGVVTYCLDKGAESKTFALTKALYREFGRS